MRADNAAVFLPMRGNDRVREKQADDMGFVKVEVIHRQYAAMLCLTQNVGQRLHAEAVVVGDEPLRLPQGKAGEGVGLRGVGKAEFIFAVFIFADEKIVEDVFQFFFRAVHADVLQPLHRGRFRHGEQLLRQFGIDLQVHKNALFQEKSALPYTGAHKKVISEITIMASVRRGW